MTTAGRSTARRSRPGSTIGKTGLAGLCVALAVVALPAGLAQPGVPITLRADEASWYLAATSLAHDGDLRVDEIDLERLFDEYAYAQDMALRLAGADRGEPSIAVDPLYPLVAAPFVWLLASDGLRVLNALLFVLVVACCARLLQPADRPGRSSRPTETASRAPTVPAAAGLLVTSAVALHVLWLRPALLAAALVAGALALRPPVGRTDGRTVGSRASALSGLLLGLAIGVEPWTATVAPAILVAGLGRGGLLERTGARDVRRATAAFAVALALALGLVAVADHLAAPKATRTIEATNEATIETFRVSAPSDRPWLDAEATTSAPDVLGRPERGPSSVLLPLLEQRTGLLPYFPLAVVLGLAFLVPSRRRRALVPTLLLAAGLAIVVFARPYLPSSEIDGALPGDPRLVAVAPAWFALAAATPSIPALLVGVTVGALLLAPALFTPFLPPVPDAATHHYARGVLWRHLPLDLAHVGAARTYLAEEIGPSDVESWRVWRPGGQTVQRTDQLWTLGGERVPLVLDLPGPIEEGLFLVGSYAAPNRIGLRLGDAATTLEPAVDAETMPPTGWSTVVRLRPGDGVPVVAPDGAQRTAYLLTVSSTRGAKPLWGGVVADSDYVGATLAYFGSAAHLDRDVYGVEWLGCAVPPRLLPGEEALALGRVRNTSGALWTERGAVRVRLAHRWLDADGTRLADGRRADLDEPLRPGAATVSWLPVRAPDRPGRYTVVFEPLYENVAWFTDRAADPESVVCRAEVTVVDR